MILSYEEINKMKQPLVIEGIIVDVENNDPVKGASVCIENGLGESFSAEDGIFSVSSYERFPVILIIKYLGFETIQLVVTTARGRLLICLRKAKLKCS